MERRNVDFKADGVESKIANLIVYSSQGLLE